MLIDCADCPARDVHCGDCVVGALLAGPGPVGLGGHLEEPERAALAVLADFGMVAPLRLLSEAAPPRQARPA